MKNKLILAPLVIASFLITIISLLAPGCSIFGSAGAPSPRQAMLSARAALEGTWEGEELAAGPIGPAKLKISGQTFEFHGRNESDWMKGTFILQIDVFPPQLIGSVRGSGLTNEVGRNLYAIYKLQNHTLALAENHPGNFDFPTSLDGGDRRFVFRRSP